MLVGLERERRWALIILLAPQMVFGIANISSRVTNTIKNKPDLYQTIIADAGPGFVPSRDLVAWPVLAGVTLSAINKVQLINGNDGTLLGPIDWRVYDSSAMAPIVFENSLPYWLICVSCSTVLEPLATHGLHAKFLGSNENFDNGLFEACRIDR